MIEEVNDELRKCPFCGGNAYIDLYDRSYTAVCWNCHAETYEFKDKEDCIKAWNTRPIEDEKDKEIARLNKLMRQKCYDCLTSATGTMWKK